MKRTALALALCAATTVHAADWTPVDKGLLATAIAVEAVDYGQTLDIRHHANMAELNPILGPHPSDAKVTGYFAASMVATYVIADHLGPGWRKAYLGGVIVFEGFVTKRNARMGITVHF